MPVAEGGGFPEAHSGGGFFLRFFRVSRCPRRLPSRNSQASRTRARLASGAVLPMHGAAQKRTEFGGMKVSRQYENGMRV